MHKTLSQPLRYTMFEVCERLVSILCSFRSHFTGWRDFRMTLIMVSVGVRYLFYQPIDEKIKKWPLHFPVRENPNKEEALINWPIVLGYDVKAKHRLISRKFFWHEVFSPERSLNQPKATRVCIRSINHSNRSFFVRLFFSVLFTRFRVKVIRKSLHPFMSARRVIRHCVDII